MSGKISILRYIFLRSYDLHNVRMVIIHITTNQNLLRPKCQSGKFNNCQQKNIFQLMSDKKRLFLSGIEIIFFYTSIFRKNHKTSKYN